MYSPDGRLVGSIADNDRLLKVWYNFPTEISRYQSDDNSMGFVYLEHPLAVNDFSWRRWPEFTIHSTFVVNVLVTSCRDNLCRVWSESAADEPLGLFLTAIIDPEGFPGFEPVNSGFRLHWLDCRTLMAGLDEQVQGLRVAGPGVTSTISLHNPRHSGDDDTASVGTGGGRSTTTTPAGTPKMNRVGSECSNGTEDSDFVMIADDGGFRSAVMTRTAFSLEDNNLASPHVPSKVTRACLTEAVPSHESSAPDILYFVHPNGSIVFWSISFLDTAPRRSPFIKLISGTDVGVIPTVDGASVIGQVRAYLDCGLCLWRRRVARLSENGRGDFERRVVLQPRGFPTHWSTYTPSFNPLALR
eukprot:m.293902 g.293902  ORF g.293902 m.293902 type:complete len:358 (-) comp27149_c1_seq1:516-1589(-)